LDDSHQKRGKVNQRNDNTTKANLVNPVIAKISLLPIGRFDEMLKTFEQALPGCDFVMHRSGLPDRSRRLYGYRHCHKCFHLLNSFEYLIGTIPGDLE
jgi:hypothetical protein